MKQRILLILPVMLAGCVAADPKRIPATPTPSFAYTSLDCGSLATEDARLAEEVGYLSYRQNNRRNMDGLGVLAVGVSPSGLGAADWESQIAQLKGQKEAVGTVMTSKACTPQRAAIDDSTKARIRYRDRAKADQT